MMNIHFRIFHNGFMGVKGIRRRRRVRMRLLLQMGEVGPAGLGVKVEYQIDVNDGELDSNRDVASAKDVELLLFPVHI